MSKAILKSLALLGALAISGSAYAGTVTIEELPIDASKNVNGFSVHAPGADYVSTSSSYVVTGAISVKGDLDGDDVAESFLAFCIDIATTLKLPGDYFDYGTDGSWLGWGDAKLASVQSLFDVAYGGLSTAADYAGFQLALWEIIYDTPDGVTSGSFHVKGLNDGGFDVPQQDAVNQANAFLAALSSDDTSRDVWALSFLQAPTLPDSSVYASQSLITATKLPPVPVPAAGLLLLAGLGGLGAMARRRRQA